MSEYIGLDVSKEETSLLHYEQRGKNSETRQGGQPSTGDF